MRFGLFSLKGIWAFKTFREAFDFANEGFFHKGEYRCIIEGDSLTAAILAQEQESGR